MGILGRLNDWRKRTYLRRRVGPNWEQFYIDNDRWPSDAVKLQPDGSLFIPEFNITVADNTSPAKNLLLAEYLWGDMREKSGMSFKVDGDTLIAEVDGLKLGLTKSGDFDTLREVFMEHLYRFERPGEPLIVDIGANIGLASLYLARYFPGEIHAFEIVPSTAKRTEENFARNPEFAKSITFHDYGLGESDGTLEISIDPDHSAGNSMFRSRGSQKEQVRVKDAAVALQEIISERGNRTLVVKLDAEGAEYPIFRRWAEAGLVGEISVLMMEWHAQEGENVEEIRQILRSNGFQWSEYQEWQGAHGFINAFGKGV